MKAFFASLKPAFISLVCLTLLLGVVYPVFIYGIGQLFFRYESNGSLYFDKNGKVIGSTLIGQNFTKPGYFHPRPSSAGDKGYDAAKSSGSNLGPTSQKLIKAVTQRVRAYRLENKLAVNAVIPIDAVTTSASGLDPHISIENALLQVPRIAAARGIPEKDVKKLIEAFREAPTWGIFGISRVNVLRLNIALQKGK